MPSIYYVHISVDANTTRSLGPEVSIMLLLRVTSDPGTRRVAEQGTGLYPPGQLEDTETQNKMESASESRYQLLLWHSAVARQHHLSVIEETCGPGYYMYKSWVILTCQLR